VGLSTSEQQETVMSEETIQAIDLDEVSGMLEPCLQSPECSDSTQT
jgi:hypothetical protein